MISLYKVFKYTGNVHSNEVVAIPDMELDNKDVNNNDEKPVEEIVQIDLKQQAEDEAREILDNAQLKCNEIIKKAEAEAENIRKQARNEGYSNGYNEGFKSKSDEIISCLNQTNHTLDDIKDGYNDYINEYANKLGDSALEIASSILKTKLEEEPLIMCDLVEDVMSSVKDAKWAIVTLSKQLVPLVELLQSELPAKCPTIANVEVEAKDVPVGKCVVDSSVGVIDASIDEQIKNLSIRFEQLIRKEERHD